MNRGSHIAVIADDFTGAAEIGGIGLQHGLRVCIETKPVRRPDIDLQIVATDTRSMPANEAAEHIYSITRTLMESDPFLIYKKLDSVFRGNVSAELEAQLRAMKLERAVIIAANPALLRIIENGSYFIDNIPLDRTSFSSDPQHPATTSVVKELIGSKSTLPVMSLNPGEPLSDKGLIIGNVKNLPDLELWAGYGDGNTLLAGAAGFFNAVINNLKFNEKSHIPGTCPFGERALFILGSTYPKDRRLYVKMKQNSHFLSNMPEDIYHREECPEESFKSWVDEIAGAMQSQGKVLVSSMHGPVVHPGSFVRVKQVMARMVKEVMERCRVDELLIEGGNTASEILRQLDINELIPVQVRSAGVIRMKIIGREGCCLTTKPGSYNWPENVWMKKEIEKMNRSESHLLSPYG